MIFPLLYLIARQWVTHSSVKTRGHQDQLGTELVGDWEDDVEEGHEVLWVPVGEAVPGDVNIEPSSVPLPHLVIVSVRAAGIELSVVITEKFIL